MLKPQDVVVLAKLVSMDDPSVPIHRLAGALSMSPSEVHHAIHRAADAALVRVVEHRTHAHEKHVDRVALLELALSGLKYVFPAVAQTHARGIPTGWASPALAVGASTPEVLPPVWPTEDGPVAGLAVTPLYRCVPRVAQEDPRFYALMASIDAIRTRCPRAGRAARTTLTALLDPSAPSRSAPPRDLADPSAAGAVSGVRRPTLRDPERAPRTSARPAV